MNVYLVEKVPIYSVLFASLVDVILATNRGILKD